MKAEDTHNNIKKNKKMRNEKKNHCFNAKEKKKEEKK